MFTSSSHLPLPTQASPGQFFNFSSGGSMIPSQSPPSKSHLKVQKCEFSGYFCQLLAIFIPWSIADSITFSISNPLGSYTIGNIISIIFISDWIGSGTLFLSRNYFFVKKGENSQQCRFLMNFVLLRLYVKSISEILEVHILPF